MRCGALVEGWKADDGIFVSAGLIDVLRRDLGFDYKLVALGHNQHQRFSGVDDAANREHRHLVNHAVNRAVQFNAPQLVVGSSAAFREFGNFALRLAQLLQNFAFCIMVDAKALDLDLGNLALA